ncbi:IS4 family transposase [Rhodoferax sp.]|uniref:IS4 family transposase n=1 Tax=Rhodoferax sp. TaxID=50421 RepID=UPI00260E4A0E|nr:IS4 family transposase [Rhodoferax sp.]MDD5479264.1 IS4 family transposase [Rhodoferax sp.]
MRQFLGRFARTGYDTLSGLLTAEQLQSLIHEHCPDHRNRVYPPLTTVSLFLEQVLGADHSCQDAVARGLSSRVAQGCSASSLDTGAYCKARQRLSLQLLAALSKALAARLCQAQSNSWRWRGREIKLIDGTTVFMPDTDNNQTTYPQSSQQKAGLGFPMMRIVGIVSLGCGAVLDWVCGACAGKLTGETAMMRQLDATLNPGDILLMDRYYTGYFTVARLLARGVDFVSRQHQLRHTDFEQGQRLGKGDHVAQWRRPVRPKWMTPEEYEKVPQCLQVREARVGEWTLITSLKDAKAVNRLELNEIYGWRWHIELDLRCIKSVMQMEMLRCKTPEMVLKEVAAHLLAYNLVRAVMAQAANKVNCTPRQLSFKAALQQLRAFEERLRHGAYASVVCLCEVLIGGIGQVKIPYRPGRVEPRAIKRRSKNVPHLRQPRAVIKAQLQAQHELIMAAVYA